MGDHTHLDAIDGLEAGGRHDLGGGAAGDQAAAMQGDQGSARLPMSHSEQAGELAAVGVEQDRLDDRTHPR